MCKNKRSLVLLLVIILLGLTACRPTEEIPINISPEEIQSSGERVFAVEKEFVTTFTNRHSGTQASIDATNWLKDEFTARGWQCEIDSWDTVNYSMPITFHNLVCRLPGVDPADPREIVVIAHKDQSPLTIQGADDDGSGVAVMLDLAEIFGQDAPPRYNLTFIASDGEEYGMLGSKRFMDNHPNTENIIAGISLDNVGQYYYDGVLLENQGQFKGYGPIWLNLLTQDAAQAAAVDWDIKFKAPLDQALDQAVTVSFTDQGPIIAKGVPAVNIAGSKPAEFADQHYQLWHDPGDLIENQDPYALGQAEMITEALIRQLLSMDSFPAESGPYLYFEDSGQQFKGAPLFLIFMGFVSLFFVGSFIVGRNSLSQGSKAWSWTVVHYLGLLLPLIASLLFLYLMVPLGLLLEFDLYPFDTKNPMIFEVNWTAVLVLLIAMVVFYTIGQLLVRRVMKDKPQPKFAQVKSLGMLIIGLCGVYILIKNPFSLLFFVPLLFWFLILGKPGLWKIWDIAFLLLGGLMVYALMYFFGFIIMRYNWYFLWFFLNMFSTGTITFDDLLVSVIIIASGVSMVVTPAGVKAWVETRRPLKSVGKLSTAESAD